MSFQLCSKTNLYCTFKPVQPYKCRRGAVSNYNRVTVITCQDRDVIAMGSFQPHVTTYSYHSIQ